MQLKGRSLLTLEDFSRDEILAFLDLSAQARAERRAGTVHQRFLGRCLAMLFEKPSTRTRSAFETAFGEEGGHPVFLGKADIQLGKESVEDTARVLGRMYDAILFRGFHQETVRTLAAFSEVPVYNGLTDARHPTQVLADLLTIREQFGRLEGIHLAYVGDARNNIASSLMIGCSKLGMGCTMIAPESLLPAEHLLQVCKEWSNGSAPRLTTDLTAVSGADVVYTDVWISMGEETQEHERLQLLKPYQVSAALMASTGKPGSVFMHDLPAVKGNEVTQEVFESPQSLVWEQAENRKHTAKAVMLATMLGLT